MIRRDIGGVTTPARAAAVLAAAIGLLAAAATAQEWPTRTVQIIVPVPAGGGLDPFARAVAAKMTDTLKQRVVVDNKPGASGSIGTAFVAKSAADGYTFGFVYDTHAVNPALIARMPYDTIKDLAHVMLVGRAPLLVVANPRLTYRDFAEVVGTARARPDSISIGFPGNGSVGHLALLQLARQDGVRFNHVPYKGGGPLVQDLAGSQIDLGIAGVPNMVSAVKGKLIRPLAVTADARSVALPDVPTLKEQGIHGITAYTWWGFVAPAGTPKAILDRVHGALSGAIETPDIRKMLGETLAMEAIASSPEAFSQFLAGETAVWGKVVRENNVRAE